MATFRETRNALLLAHSADIIPDEESVLLYDLHTSKNLDYAYFSYNKFDSENWLTLSSSLNLDFWKEMCTDCLKLLIF